MIEFIQDYTTKSLPPEVFEQGQQVKRSEESELYFVRLGVAGFLVNGELFDQDYQPIVKAETTTMVVVAGDRRFGDAGRAGEMLGLDAPQRATTGPGNAVVFGDQHAGISKVEVDQLSSDLAASIQQLDDHRSSTASQITELTEALTSAQGARETALSELAAAQADRDQYRADLAEALSKHDEHVTASDTRHETDAARIAELEKQLAAAKPAAGEQGSKIGKAK